MNEQVPQADNDSRCEVEEKSSTEAMHQALVEKVQSMSLQERFDSLIRCGIVTQSGQLAPAYS
jgi:hypothetical protein